MMTDESIREATFDAAGRLGMVALRVVVVMDGDGGYFRESRTSFAARLDVTRQAVVKALGRLVAAGMIRREGSAYRMTTPVGAPTPDGAPAPTSVGAAPTSVGANGASSCRNDNSSGRRPPPLINSPPGPEKKTIRFDTLALPKTEKSAMREDSAWDHADPEATHPPGLIDQVRAEAGMAFRGDPNQLAHIQSAIDCLTLVNDGARWVRTIRAMGTYRAKSGRPIDHPWPWVDGQGRDHNGFALTTYEKMSDDFRMEPRAAPSPPPPPVRTETVDPETHARALAAFKASVGIRPRPAQDADGSTEAQS